MLNRAHIAAEVVEEIEAFLLAHGMSQTVFLVEHLGTNDHLLRNLRRGGNTSIAMLGRVRDCLKALDPGWILKDDRRDQVLGAARRFAAEPSLDNQRRLIAAEKAFAAWPGRVDRD